MASRRNPRVPKGTPTGTNLYVLGTLARRIDLGERITHVPSVEIAHARRVIAAGLLSIDAIKGLEVTPAGRKVLASDRSAQSGYGVGNARNNPSKRRNPSTRRYPSSTTFRPTHYIFRHNKPEIPVQVFQGEDGWFDLYTRSEIENENAAKWTMSPHGELAYGSKYAGGVLRKL